MGKAHGDKNMKEVMSQMNNFKFNAGEEEEIISLREAIKIRRVIRSLGVNPHIHLTARGRATLHFDLRGETHSEKVREMAKALSTTFDKEVSCCGFLKYSTDIGRVSIYANTKSCFYGGKAKVVSRPRTHAYCVIKNPGKANSEM